MSKISDYYNLTYDEFVHFTGNNGGVTLKLFVSGYAEKYGFKFKHRVLVGLNIYNNQAL